MSINPTIPIPAFFISYTLSSATPRPFILGTYHGLPKKYLQSYLDEYSFRFSRRHFGGALLERLALSVSLSRSAD